MDNDPASSSTLRFRSNAVKPCVIDDTVDPRPKNNSSVIKVAAKECGISRSVSGDNVGNNGRIKGRSRILKPPRRGGNNSKQRLEDRSLHHLMTITAVLLVLVVGGLIYLAFLVLVIDPDLQHHIPHLQKYIDTSNESLFSSWRSKLSNPSQEEVITIDTVDDASLNLDASEIDNRGKDFTVLSEIEHDNDSSTSQHRYDSTLQSPSPIYAIPNSMAHIGDKSEEYARVRQDWDERYPPNSPERSVHFTQGLLATGDRLSSIYNRLQPPPLSYTSITQTIENDETTFENDESSKNEKKNWNYDIYDCPNDPPPGYPREYKTIDILKHWPPTQNLPLGKYDHHRLNNSTNEDIERLDDSNDGDSTTVMAHLGLCVFDYTRDFEKALRYRSKEVPFVVRNDPRVAETVERWNDENYRRKLFGNIHHSKKDEAIRHSNDDNDSFKPVYHRAERSITNQVLFRHSRKKKARKFNRHPSRKKEERKTENFQEQDQSPYGRQTPPMPPATKLISMTYDQWYKRAMDKEANSVIDSETGIHYYDANLSGNKSLYYYYFRLVGCGEKEGCERNSTEYLFDELPFFQPRRFNQQKSESRSNRKRSILNHARGRGHRRSLSKVETSPEDDIETPNASPESSSSHSYQENLYLVQPEKQRGIHCRFGMPGMIAANHYDASRNAIAVLGGSRRYILSRPEQCPNLGLYSMGHPSARHSKVDWTTASEDYQNFSNHGNENGETHSWASSSDDPSWVDYKESLSLLVNNATSTEVVLQAGDVLYLPAYWFHFIISLTTNMQCNTRSGRDGKDDQIMTDCGFPPPRHDK